MIFSQPKPALPGRTVPVLRQPCWHAVFGHQLGTVAANSRVAYFALGCFWGAEKLFWTVPGVTSTAAGYAGGTTPNPTYQEVCSGLTGHAETVLVAHDPDRISYPDLLAIFFENHDPTQGMRQGNDLGTQYRSAIFPTDDEQAAQANAMADQFQRSLTAAGYGLITTEISPLDRFYSAEEHHQQYLAKNPDGYCPVHATGVSCRPSEG